jgi:hypothetical protein
VGVTRGDVPLLRALGGDLRDRTTTGTGPTGDYDAAVRAFNAGTMSPELATTLTSRAPGIEALLRTIGTTDDQLAAYADAVEWADANVPGFAGMSERVQRDLLQALTAALLDGRSSTRALERAAADALGTHAAELARSLIDDGDAPLEDWTPLLTLLRQLEGDEAFAVAFLRVLGPRDLAAVPMAIERAWLEGGGASGSWPPDTTAAWDALQHVSSTFATASHTIGRPGGLPRTFVPQLLAAPADDHVRALPPTFGEVGLLFSAGHFSDAALVPLAGALGEWQRARNLPAFAGAHSPWGIFFDPATTMLPAIATSPAAAAASPDVFAQLLAVGQLDLHTLDVAVLEAARHASADAAYVTSLGTALEGLRLPAEHVARFTDELLAAGLALELVGAGHETIGALSEMVSQAGRDLRSHPDAAARRRASRILRDTPPWVRQLASARGHRMVGRALPAAGVGLDIVGHLDAGRGSVETVVRTAGGAGGAMAGSAGAAKVASPLLLAGPPGWVGYGTVVVLGGIGGGILGDGLTGLFFRDDPDAELWVREFGRDGIPAPGPPEEIEWR